MAGRIPSSWFQNANKAPKGLLDTSCLILLKLAKCDFDPRTVLQYVDVFLRHNEDAILGVISMVFEASSIGVRAGRTMTFSLGVR